jgi:hypothetical protein
MGQGIYSSLMLDFSDIILLVIIMINSLRLLYQTALRESQRFALPRSAAL